MSALAAGDVPRVVRDARRRAPAVAAIPARRVFAMLESLRPHWQPGGRYRDAFLGTRPERDVGWSTPMIHLALDRFAAKLDAGVARRRVATQIGGEASLDGFVSAGGAMRHAAPLGVVLHVVSGNVFFGPAESLLAGLLTKNVNLVKSPSEGGEFARRFVESIEEADPEIAAAVSLLEWSGGDDGVEGALASSVDGVVVAAGDEVVASYRRLAAPNTSLIELGPRASVAVISARGRARAAAGALACDVALWDQFACTGAQCVYVEGREAAMRVAEDLAAALEELCAILPEGAAGLDERIEVARLRDLGAFGETTGESRLHRSRHGLWSVVFEESPRFEPSPLRRCVRVKPFDSLDELCAALGPLRGTLQTIGLAAAAEEVAEYRRRLVECGARRFCAVGGMNDPAADGLHDGVMELQRMVRWVDWEGPL